MKDDDKINFNYPDQEPIQFTVAKCRQFCPDETSALVLAANRVTEAEDSDDKEELARRLEVFGRTFEELSAALLRYGRSRGL